MHLEVRRKDVVFDALSAYPAKGTITVAALHMVASASLSYEQSEC
jgi:hypothetical protein